MAFHHKYIFNGEKKDIVDKAEKTFLEICSENIDDFDTYTDDDLTAILDNGYAQWGENSVAIVWPNNEV